MVQVLPERVDDRVRSYTRRGPSRDMRRFHPMMFEELAFHPALKETDSGPAVAWLMFVSTFKDDLPWLFKIGLDLYRALRDGNERAVDVAAQSFRAIVKATAHGPFIYEMMGSEGEELHFLLRHLPEMTDRFIRGIMRTRRRVRPKGALSAVAALPPSEEN